MGNIRGGKRIGSGRKKGIETKVINFRVPKDKAAEIKSLVALYIKNLF